MRHATLTAAACLLCTSALFAQGGSALDEQLLEAVWGGQCNSVAKLLKKGANPNARSEKVGTALQRASAICEAPVIALLLERGADLEARDQRGWTPLLHAVNRSRPDGVWRKFQNEAVGNDQVENVRALIAAGADVNARDNSDSSLMHFAMRRGHSEVLHVLHESGAQRAVTVEQQKGRDPLDRSPIDGVTLQQWARANGRMVHGVPDERVIAELKLTKARWEKVHEAWTERLRQHTLELGEEYAKAFNEAMRTEAAAASEPGTKGDEPPISFEKWIEVLEATYAASERVPSLYDLSSGDWTRVNTWWQRKLNAKQVDKALYDRLSARYEKQFAAQPPTRVGAVLRPGALESNSEPVPLEKWVEMSKAMEAGMTWTLKRQGLTLGQWIRANNWWGQKFNKALLGLDQATPAQRAEAQKMHAERIRLSEAYKKRFAAGVPW